MEQFIGFIGIAVVLFASTNVDDVLVLIGFFADPKFKVRHVVIGQYIGIGALYGASVIASLISLVIPPAYIGLLGLAPIFIGLKKLWELRQGTDPSEEALEDHEKAASAHGNIVAAAAVTVANGGDNIAIYTAFFATRAAYDIAVIGFVFAIMTALWLWAAYRLTHHHTIGEPIRRYGHRLAPFVLIALGFLILYEAGTFGLVRNALPPSGFFSQSN